MKSRFTKTELGLFLMATATPLYAYSEVYMNEDQALQSIFETKAATAFTKKDFTLTPDEMKKVEELSGEKVHHPSFSGKVGKNKEALFIDQVLGKHEFITYAVGITGEGKVKGIEILEYRETYGQGVKKPEWRQQFVGKDSHSTLKVGNDIVNLSGATLSSAHITAGVRRMLQTYEIIKNRL